MKQVSAACEMATQVWSFLPDLKGQQQNYRQEVLRGVSAHGS